MVLNRKALESKLLQKLLAHPELNFTILSDEELIASIGATLKQRTTSELWIFAYGSLIWNPLFPYIERRVVTIKEWQRQFCLLAPVGRGTIENPGLVLGLERGTYCEGIAYRLPIDDNLESELLLLWRREMVVGSYIPTWVKAQKDDGEIEAIAFTVNCQHPAYVNNLSTAKIVQSIATARGMLGSSAEYLSYTVQGLLAAGIEDRHLLELDRLVKSKQQLLDLTH